MSINLSVFLQTGKFCRTGTGNKILSHSCICYYTSETEPILAPVFVIYEPETESSSVLIFVIHKQEPETKPFLTDGFVILFPSHVFVISKEELEKKTLFHFFVTQN
jgi:hypothetical protein